MRTYHIFKINKYFSYMYFNKPYKLYSFLEELYHTKEYDMVLTYKLYEQIAINFNKLTLNYMVSCRMKNSKNYYHQRNVHVLTNNYEYSKLNVTNSNLKIRTNVSYPSFFDIIDDNNLFVCDFQNRDYFWLNEVKHRQMDKTLV